MVGRFLTPPVVDRKTIVNYLAPYGVLGARMAKSRKPKVKDSDCIVGADDSEPPFRLDTDLLAPPDQDTLQSVLEQAHGLGEWTDAAAESIDRVHLAWTLSSLQPASRGPEQAEPILVELLRYFRRLVLPEQEDSLDALRGGYRARWDGFAALLEHQLERWQSRADPGWLLRRPILRTVLECVHATPDMTQSSVLDAVNLARERNQEPAIRKAYLSRLLATLEGHGLIVRTRIGREQRVALGPELRAEDLFPRQPVLGLPGPSTFSSISSLKIAEALSSIETIWEEQRKQDFEGSSQLIKALAWIESVTRERTKHRIDWHLSTVPNTSRVAPIIWSKQSNPGPSAAPLSDPATDAPAKPVD